MTGKKLAAFTIMEITVAMLISALVIAITWTVYLSFSKSYQTYSKRHEDMAAVLTLDEVLRKDFDRAAVVQRDSSGMVAHFTDHDVRYVFDTAFILRTVLKIRTDTFKVRSDSLSMSFENNPVETISGDREKQRIDQLDLLLFLQKEKIPYHYRKVYSSADLIHRPSHAVH